MKNYFPVLKTCPLFSGFNQQETAHIIQQLNGIVKPYKKNAAVWHIGQRSSFIGIVLEGQVRIETQDYWGNRSILAKVSPGELFGEAFSCAEIEHIPVNVLCAEDAEILFLDFHKADGCPGKLMENMLKTLAGKNVILTTQIEHITKRTTREKLLSYLSQQAVQQGGDTFDIPFSRQELADYLAVDRSAMSNELSKLRNSGVLDFHKNHFRLLKD